MSEGGVILIFQLCYQVSSLDGAVTLTSSTAAVRFLDSGWSMNHVLFQNYDSPVHTVFALGDSFNPATSVANVSKMNSPNILFSRCLSKVLSIFSF